MRPACWCVRIIYIFGILFTDVVLNHLWEEAGCRRKAKHATLFALGPVRQCIDPRSQLLVRRNPVREEPPKAKTCNNTSAHSMHPSSRSSGTVLNNPVTSHHLQQQGAFHSYFMRSISNGITWEKAANSLEPISTFWVQVFHFYVAFCSFALLNAVPACLRRRVLGNLWVTCCSLRLQLSQLRVGE